MGEKEIIFKIVEIGLQVVMAIFAGMALSIWKKELRGRDKYNQIKSLLEYIGEIRFTVFSKSGSIYFIYLNDILTDKKFYEDDISPIAREKVFFDRSVMGLFHQVNTRSDFFLTKEIRTMIGELSPMHAKVVNADKNKTTYIHMSGVKIPEIISLDKSSEKESYVYSMHGTEKLTIEAYFRKWERLIRKLQKLM
jgi:hypothetical protein